ncbi:MAG: hypothetical protein EA351_07550 [Gemmatimonadales bacterium]|nr:MAG: hypothetical protein EA351_07550 [Gemmatimonadales bacterium]
MTIPPLNPVPRRTSMRRFTSLALGPLILAAFLCSPPAQAQTIPTPLEHFGQELGAEGHLANWHQLSAYYERVALASPRVQIDTLGPSTLGEPFVKMIITSEANHQNLDRYREIQHLLSDPRRIASDAERDALIAEGRTVVLTTSHIHSTEVGAGQMPARLVHQLATSDEPDILEILDETILILIPSLNPDGTQMVSEWWNEWKGTEFEGAPLPRLYHHYIGHNNNRDWFFFAQKETRMTVLGAHNSWRPQIVHDVHQMGSNGARLFIPPYIDPVEPNVDPRLIAGLNQLGTWIRADMTKDGYDGIVTDAIFDIYTPARAYMHYHGGVRILSETASASWANPIEIDFDDLGGDGNYDARVMSSNFPSPWMGGRWGLDDIVDYMEAASISLLRNAATKRTFWLENYYEVHRAAVEGWDSWPAAWVVPGDQAYEAGIDQLLRVLTTGNVEVHRTRDVFTTGGHTFPEGSYVIPMQQPYAAFAQTMLEPQEYPDLRQYPGGPPIRPYDATAHSLPLLFGIEAHAIDQVPSVDLSEPIPRFEEFSFPVPAHLLAEGPPRIGLYRSYNEPMPQGWTRWLFDLAGVRYYPLRNDDIQAGDLANLYDVIIVQDQSPNAIRNGYPADRMPEPFAGGIGESGEEALRAFLEAGGRIVAIDEATDWAIDAFDLGVANAVTDLPGQDFYIPGSILRLDLDPTHEISQGVPAENFAWYWRTSRAFEVTDPDARIVGRYGEGDPRLAGWVLGEEHVAGKPALVEVPVGAGEVILFGFQPNFRGQTVGSWPIFFNALR